MSDDTAARSAAWHARDVATTVTGEDARHKGKRDLYLAVRRANLSVEKALEIAGVTPAERDAFLARVEPEAV
jgi:hypothetical protein